MTRIHLIAATSLAVLIAAAPALADPVGGTVTAGGAVITSMGQTTTITQSTDKAIIEWQSFNVASNEKVNFVQPTASSIALNRVLGVGPSMIDGQIDANGRVFIINADGIVFGAGAKVDVNGLLATSIGISDANFMAGSYVFDQPGALSASIVNHGAIKAADAGMIAFVAPHVQNSGLLQARFGTVALGAGEAFTLDFFGDRLIVFAANDAAGSKSGGVIVDGAIEAESGTILIAATAARDFIDTVINVEADLVARSASMQGGRIILVGGDQSAININAALDATGTPGGSISVAGGVVNVAATGELLTDAKTGQADGGDILVHSSSETNFAGLASSEPGAAAGVGGDITIGSDGVLIFAGTARAGSPPRAGVINLNGAIDETGGASGNGGGNGSGNGPPIVVPGQPIKNKASDSLTEVLGTAADVAAVDIDAADERPGAQVLFGDDVAFDFTEANANADASGEARLMCMHGVSSAACGGGASQ